MPIRLATTVLTVDAAKMHKVDPRNVGNLFGMWTVFSKCADSMEEGRRLENLSWRLWNRETFCCESQPQLTTTPAIDVATPRPRSHDIPELSASVDSVSSDEIERSGYSSQFRTEPVDIKSSPTRSTESISSTSRGTEKHITSLGLEKMIFNIKEKKELEPLSPSIAEAVPATFPSTNITPRAASPTTHAPLRFSDSSSSTNPLSSPDSDLGAMHTVGSDTSAELMTSHSVVRGFSPSQISSSFRSHTHLAPTSVPTKSITHTKAEEQKKKGGMFLLGGSSGEDDSSFEEQMSIQPPQSSLSAGLKKPMTTKKQTSFKDEVESRIIFNKSHEDEEVFESDDEGVSESAIEEEEDDSDWEDSPMESGESSVNEKQLFQRVDSKPNLTSRRSLLTTLMHQKDRATALATMASRSTPAMRRSEVSSPDGQSIASSPEEDLTMHAPEIPRSRPIIVTTSNTHPPALSPRTTRRNMLATELTESLRKHLLWERQQKSTTANAVVKRRHTAHDVANLQEYPGQIHSQGSSDSSRTNSWNHYFDHGLGEYHQKGW